MKVTMTQHAVKRTKERAGIPKSAATRNAEKALQFGIQHNETSGSLNRYLTGLYFKHKTANNVRIYCNNVYIFNGAKLITMFQLPQKYRGTAKKNSRRKAMLMFKDAKYWKAKYQKLYRQQQASFEVLHNTIRRYNDKHIAYTTITSAQKRMVEEIKGEMEKFKKLYADELQKRLDLAAKVEAMEKDAKRRL